MLTVLEKHVADVHVADVQSLWIGSIIAAIDVIIFEFNETRIFQNTTQD